MGKATFVFLSLATLCMVLNGSHGIKQLVVKYESCGPEFKVRWEPDPVKLASGVVANGTLVTTAAHSMLMGTVEAHLNVWPNHLKITYCEDGTTDVDPKGCYISKGETRTFAGQLAIDESFASLFTKPIIHGNATVRNEYGDLMVCGRFNITVIDI